MRLGLIGLGRIGSFHAGTLTDLPAVDSLVVTDLVPAKTKQVAERFGAEPVDSLDALLAAGVDGVVIAASTDAHPQLVLGAVDAGLPVFCEKPVAGSGAEGAALLRQLHGRDVPVQIGFQRRFDAGIAAAHAAVRSGELGWLHTVRSTTLDPAPPPRAYIASSGGMFRDCGVHDFDVLRWVTGSEVVEVYARGAVRVDPAFADAHDVDTAVITLVHENGCLTTIDNSRQAVYGYDQRVEVFGSAGMAASENPLAHTGVVRTAAGARAAVLPTFFLDRYVPSYVREWEAFVRAVRSGDPTPAGAADARAPLVIGLAAWRSLREGRAVRVEEVDP